MLYKQLAELYEELEKTSKRLEKTYLISEFLKKVHADDLKAIILLIQGKIFPAGDERKIGVAARSAIKAISTATGIEAAKVEHDWKKTGDLGLTAEHLISKKKQATLFSRKLDVEKVFKNLRSLATITGAGTVDKKIKLVSELLASASPLEARYIIRNVLEDLRVGAGEGSLRDAIVWAYFGDDLGIKYDKEKNDIELNDREQYNNYIEAVEKAYDLSNDFAKVAKAAKTGKLKTIKDITLEVGEPIKVMLYQKAEDIEDAFKIVGKPAACEYKYDGFRLNIHRKNDEIKLFTRRLENVTKQFPDVVEIIRKNVKSKNYILDTEVIGIDPKTKTWLPFQNISQRIKRKYDIHKMTKETPVVVNVFDVIEFEGKNIIAEPFKERRAIIKKIVKNVPDKLHLAKQLVTSNVKEAEKFYKEALAKGNEGIMVKALDKPYKPGSRVGYGVKVKPIMETLDLVIVGAEWGTGKRAHWLSSFVIACRGKQGEFLDIGKFGTGVKEKEEAKGTTFKQFTKMLKPLILSEKGKEVKLKPKIIVEINYEEIQKSPTYSSGYALRFPRLVRLREDRGPSDASTIDEVKRLYKGQK